MKESRICHPKIYLLGINHFDLVIFLKTHMEKLWKPSRNYPFVKGEKISICKGVSLYVPGKRSRAKSTETLVNGKGMNLNLHNNLSLGFVLCLKTWLSSCPSFFVFSWRWHLKSDGLSYFRELLGFPGFLPCIQEVYILLNFCLFFFF